MKLEDWILAFVSVAFVLLMSLYGAGVIPSEVP